jgi:hypothetical protein
MYCGWVGGYGVGGFGTTLAEIQTGKPPFVVSIFLCLRIWIKVLDITRATLVFTKGQCELILPKLPLG